MEAMSMHDSDEAMVTSQSWRTATPLDPRQRALDDPSSCDEDEALCAIWRLTMSIARTIHHHQRGFAGRRWRTLRPVTQIRVTLSTQIGFVI
jgi:hypothetical protein